MIATPGAPKESFAEGLCGLRQEASKLGERAGFHFVQGARVDLNRDSKQLVPKGPSRVVVEHERECNAAPVRDVREGLSVARKGTNQGTHLPLALRAGRIVRFVARLDSALGAHAAFFSKKSLTILTSVVSFNVFSRPKIGPQK